MTPEELQEILEFAVDAAREAGRFTLRHFQRQPAVERKADNSPVTIADRGAEELLRERIEKAFPNHGILGEEHGEKPGSEPARWILDPIDGTISFIYGVPLFTNLVGLEWRGEMVLGVINAPALGEIVYGARGLGARWNDRPARVSKVPSLSEACLTTTSTHFLAARGREAPYRKLRDRCRTDRGWPDAYAFLLLATGRVDLVLEGEMKIWDCAAPCAVVTAAGGTFGDWKGEPTHRAPEALATNGALEREAVRCLDESAGEDRGMKPYTVAVEIDLPRDRVIELFDDPDNMPKWQPGLQSFEHLSGEPGQPGAKARLVYLNGKRSFELIETVVVRDLPNEFNGHYEWPGGKNTLDNRFIELGPDRTRWESTCAYHFTGFFERIMGVLMPGFFRKQNLQFMENFKAFCEDGADVRDLAK